MNTSPFLGLLRFVLAGLASLAATLATGLLLQAFNPFSVPEDPAFFRLLVGTALITGPALWYLIAESRFHGLRLVGLALVVYIGSTQVLAHIETLAFNFLFRFSAAELVYLVVSEALTAVILVPLVVTVAGKWKARAVQDRVGRWPALTPGAATLRVALLAGLWYFVYMLAGFLIADPITHDYYAAKMPDLASINAWLPLVQWGRGVLWTGLFVLAIRLANRPLVESGLVVGLLFGVFHAVGLLLPNASMPAEMRLSHLPEIVVSLVWQGAVTAAVLGWRRKASPSSE